jgi:hypothetical protein
MQDVRGAWRSLYRLSEVQMDLVLVVAEFRAFEARKAEGIAALFCALFESAGDS